MPREQPRNLLAIGRRDAALYNVARRIRIRLENGCLTPFVTGHNGGRRGLVVRATLGADGGERWRFETTEAV